MNLANKLTLFRIILVPFFVALMLIEGIPHNYLWALIIFAVASVTDFLDGQIARRSNTVTAFGKFLDPIADKILVASALICFAGIGWTSAWVVALIIAREFIVSGIRQAAVESSEKLVIQARFSGKLKTAATMLAICGILFMWILVDFGTVIGGVSGEFYYVRLIGDILMYICAGLTVISGAQYAWDYRRIFKL